MKSSSPVAPVGFALLDTRRHDYGHHARRELIELLAAPLGRVLDVGCAKGETAAVLRERGATHLVGLEIDSAYAQLAEQAYDEVRCGSVEDGLPWAEHSFDTILCYDVLEHLVDPWRTLARLAQLVRPGGQIHISIPNARHPMTWLPLVLRGTFDYRAQGLRDVTHLRFFGRRDLRAMIAAASLEIRDLDYVRADSRTMNFVLGITRGRAKEFAAYQWHAIATPGPGSNAPPNAIADQRAA